TPPNKALKRTKRPRGARIVRTVAPRAHSRTGALCRLTRCSADREGAGAMAELPDEIHERIAHLSNEGNSLAERSAFNGALERFRSAWDLLPEPRDEWDAALWLLTSIGDMHFQLRQYPEARQSLMAAMKSADGAPGNPFLRLRLGQAMYELGEKQEPS